MKSSGAKIFWAVVAAIVVTVIWVSSRPTAALTLDEAVHSGKVSVQFIASGDNGDSANLSISRASGVSAEVVVVIPSGTVLYSSGSNALDTQRLMTAAPVRAVLNDQTPTFNTTIQTYCLDEFAAVPLDRSDLSAEAPQDGGSITTEEMEPLQRLADCMASSSLTQADKQLAVWAVKDDLLSKSKDEALAFITNGLVDRMKKERREQLDGKRAQLKEMAPDLGEDDITRAIETEFENGMPELREIAAQKATEQLNSLIADDQAMLSSCGYQASEKPLFQSQ